MNRTEMDYYEVLNVPRDSTKEAITLAYRKLANQLVPNRDPKFEKDFVPSYANNHLTPLSKARQWDYINMAYDVLGNDLYRSIYDRYGESGLFEGVVLPNGYFPPYMYHGDNMKVYRSVFSSFSPYASVIDTVTNPPPLYCSAENGIGVRSQDPPVQREIQLSLEEVRFGCVKLMHVWRQEFTDDTETKTEKKRKTLKLTIPPGVTPGTRFCFKEAGDRGPTKIPSDIVFITTDKPHSYYKRQNHFDLLHVHKIDLCQALVGFCLKVETLDKRNLKICISDVVHPSYTKVIPNEGLPKCDANNFSIGKSENVRSRDYGNLIISFEIEFPKIMTRDMCIMSERFFKQLKYMEEDAAKDPKPVETILRKVRKSRES